MKQDTVEGYVEHIIFRNEENGYTVLQLKTQGSSLTCTGIFNSVSEGETVALRGNYTEHVLYGRQFKADSYEIRMPEDAAAIERYLSSGVIRGIKAALAARIVKKFGADTLRIMEEEPERLAEIKGISEKKAREIAAQMEEKAEQRSAMLFLSQYGISVSLGVKIYQHYGERIYSIIRENPYRMAEEVPGVGFKTADEIARKAGIHADDDFRIKSGLLYVLNQALAEGHCFLPREQLCFRAASLLGIKDVDMEHHIMDLTVERKVVQKEMEPSVNPVTGEEEPRTAVYGASVYYLELNTARMLCELNVKSEDSEREIQKRIAQIEHSSRYELEERQRQAVAEAVKNGLLIITGGPGTGKTTTINAIIRYFSAEGLDICLAAPTGRAAKRMTEATGYEAQTIHRLLELSGMAEESSADVHFERNEENPIEADVVIIDEMSMVDIYLMHALLSALTVGTRLILVGDMNQLPSVGPGSVLKDMIRSRQFCVVELNKIFRQASKSDIVVNAHKINGGEDVVIDNHSEDFFFLKRYDADIIIRVIIALIQEKLPPYVHARPMDIQVLTPMRKGLLGVERLNKVLQRYLNPPEPEKKEKESGEGLFREGDKVMQIRNNYQLEWEMRNGRGITVQRGIGVFNGDLGVIREINTFGECVTVEFEEGKFAEYTFKQLDELELAYAITIHKSQGSEYPAVILPLLAGPRMLLNRNLLYTAVTRARKCVTIVGSDQTFREMIHNETEQKRYTSLDKRIVEMNGLMESNIPR
ncbi:MAG: ATP-dependent RecD-like DNA helicase [Ruminococcus sp.]|jgi:exodeoxyribonuclease V alpha subunit